MKVLVSTTSFAEYDKVPLAALDSARLEVVLNPYKRKLKPEEVIELAKDCDGIIAGTEQLSADVLRKLPKLKAISRCGTGMDNVDLAAAKELGIAVRNTPNAPTQAVAELTLAFMLDLSRQVSKMDRAVRKGAWDKKMGLLLRRKTIGIIGLGRIGRCVAELLAPFSVRILACEQNPDDVWAKIHGITFVSLEELLRLSDIVTLHISYAENNRNLLNAQNIKTMKKGAFIINTSRGGLVDEAALYDALKNENLGGAALDVMEKEPYSGSLISLENVIITPHVGSYAAEARVEMETEAAKNIVAMLTEGKK